MITLHETNSSPLKMDGWNTTLLLGRPIFRCKRLVSGRVELEAVHGISRGAPGNSHIPPWERENHRLKSALGRDMLVPRVVDLA